MRRSFIFVIFFLGLMVVSAAAQDTLKIGAPQPMTGPDAPFGSKFKKAYDLALEEINGAGKTHGKNIEVIIEDHQAKNPLAATVTEKLINQYKVLALTGGRASGQAVEIASVAQRLKTPYVVDHPSADIITSKGFEWVFRNNPTGSIYPQAFNKFISDVPGALPKSAAAVYDNTVFGKTIANAAMVFLKSKNVPIVNDEAYPVNTLDFKPVMTKVKAQNPDFLLLVAVATTDAILLTRHAKEIGVAARAFVGFGGGFGVADFTTADGGQYGLPRDLNTIILFYNKTMFDAAGIAYPDESWDWAKLVEAGKQLTKDTDGDGTVDQWGFYTETTDMENYWSSLVWQNGGDIISEDRTKTLLGTPEAAGGIQFLQDLIYKEKVMAEPALFAETGDAFEQGKAAMEANGSWLVPTHTAASAELGFTFGLAPLPSGPAGRFTSVNPTGAVVYQGSKAPDAAWEFVKYLASPAAQEQLMLLKASLPVSKEVLAGPYPTSFEGADVLADSLSYAKLKPSFAGYNEFTTALQGELDVNVFNEPKKTAAQALADVVPQLDAILAAQ
jgi:ABC-type branched-subunit amino acid transport system substrate-binding protein